MDREDNSKDCNKNVHNLVRVPKNPISVVMFDGVKPKQEPLFSVSFSIRKDICL